VRPTSRLLVLDEDDRLLLMKTVAPDTSRLARWITPGGGVDPGDDYPVGTALREAHEEVGKLYSVSEFAAEIALAAVEPIPADHTKLVGDTSGFTA